MFQKVVKTCVAICCTSICITASALASSSYDMLPQVIKDKGEIKVGINGIFPPMEFKEPGTEKMIGFDVELAEALGKVVGVKIVFDDQKFDQLINSINTDRVDMVISGLSDTAVRRETLDFIDYFNTGTQCFTTKEQASTVKSIEDLSGKVLAVSGATDYLTTMKKWSADNLEAKGKPAITIMAVDSAPTARLQMIQGRAQASALSPEVLGWVAKQNPGQFVNIGPVLDPAPYGICFSKKNTELRNAVYAAMKVLFEDGTYTSLLEKWEIAAGAIAEPLINGEKL